jgi:tRNA threonylcarbamoyladenosine biosynthesis protein TsaB
MLILIIRTDKPEAEIDLYEDDKQLSYEKWLAHRQLSETIHQKIEKLMRQNRKTWQDIKAVVCFKGPGSFTGLRIGHTVANSLAANLQIPVIATNGKNWVALGIKKLLAGDGNTVALPDYGREARITLPKK